MQTQVSHGSGKKTHLVHLFSGFSGKLAATVEMMILHAGLVIRRVSDPLPHFASALKQLELAHSHLPRPDGAGASFRGLT